MRRRWISVVSAALVLAPAAFSGQEAKDPEDRLLEAELLEISTGDLEKAKAVYQAIHQDEKAPEATRARALLYLARCHRKLGEIEAAKKLLEGLVKGEAQDREVLRQARSFLRELQGGKPASPDFDWLKEMERNPEIQARVFELAMDLVDPKSDTAKRARRQLLALGALAIPVVDRIIETSRDPRHRQHLSVVLLHSGRLERLAVVLDPRFPPDGDLHAALKAFLEVVPSLGDEERGRLREAVGKLPPASDTERYRDAILVWAGDTSDFEKKLPGAESFWDSEYFGRILDREPALARPMAARILGRALSPDYKRYYVDLLLSHAPEAIEAEHWKAFFTGMPQNVAKRRYLEALEARGAFEVLASLAALEDLNVKGEIVNYLVNPTQTYQIRLRNADPRWAKVLRAVAYISNALSNLHHMAELNDGAIPEFISFLRNREKEAPDYSGHGGRPWEWKPSPKYLEAMAGLLDSKDATVLGIALEAFVWAPPETPEEVFAVVRKLQEESGEVEVRDAALRALFKRFGDREETGPSLARALLAEHERGLKEETSPPAQPPPPRVPRPVPPRAVRSGPRSARPGRPGAPASLHDHMAMVLSSWQNLKPSLYPHVLDLADSPAGARFHAWFFWTGQGTQHEPIRALVRRLESLKSPELRESIVTGILKGRNYELGDEDQGRILAFLKGAAVDPALSPEARSEAIRWPEEAPFDWIDWPRLLSSSDRLATLLFEDQPPRPVPAGPPPVRPKAFTRERFWAWVSALPEAERTAIEKAALASPQEAVRESAVSYYPLDRAEAPEVLRQALGDSSAEVKNVALRRLGNASHTRFAPVFIGLLDDPLKPVRLAAVKALKRFASPGSVEPLQRILDDPDIEVRGEALTALKEIGQAIREKAEWEEALRRSKAPLSPKPDGEKKKEL